MAHLTDEDWIAHHHNLSRFCIENRQIAWVLLIASVLWGIYGYIAMPQRKDPEVPIRQAVALTPWLGMPVEKVEQLVAKTVETRMGENAKVTKLDTTVLPGLAINYLELDERVRDTAKELDDIALKLNAVQNLPQGAGPINFIKDFGDTAALMLTVASPRDGPVELGPRASAIADAIRAARNKGLPPHLARGESPFTVVVNFPATTPLRRPRGPARLFLDAVQKSGLGRNLSLIEGAGFVGLDGITALDDEHLLGMTREFERNRLQMASLEPEAWEPVVIRDPRDTATRLADVAGPRYSYALLDRFSELVEKTLKTVPQVSKVTRSGLLDQTVYLIYSQERMSAYGLQLGNISNLLNARNIFAPGGQIDVSGRNVNIDPSGEFHTAQDIGSVVVATGPSGSPVYLRDLVDIVPSYESPARFLNYYTSRKGDDGPWERNRAVTLAVEMRSGEKIGDFAQAVDATLDSLKSMLPKDLIMARTSDQPKQVEDNIELFMSSLYEAIILVVLVSLVGFWEWRSALLMALAIPLTLAMTFGFMDALGLDLQQVSIATLIIALGLLVDDPVVAGDAIKRDLGAGHPPSIASWLGPTKLGTAILYATITNIVAYLPFLLLSGDTGNFLYSLPIVMACSLVASRIVSMTFIPLLGYYLLRPTKEVSIEERRKVGFAAWYHKVGQAAIEHRWRILFVSFGFLALGAVVFLRLPQQFFPHDRNNLAYADVWLANDSPTFNTNQVAIRAEQVITRVAQRYGEECNKPHVLKQITSFVGGGGPRFWFSVSPELEQPNYAQILFQTEDKEDMPELVPLLQEALSREVAGARIDVRELETGKAVGVPVAVRIAGPDIAMLKSLAGQVKEIFRSTPLADRIRDTWGEDSFAVHLQTNADRANLAGITNLDVAQASATAINGYQVTALHQDDKLIPVVAIQRMEERARLGDLSNLYVYSSTGPQKVPIRSVASIDYKMETSKIVRRNQFRTITVGCFPVSGVLPSEVLNRISGKLAAFEKTLPPGYRMAVAGEQEEQDKGFGELLLVLLVSVAMIYMALVFQFKNAIKPFIVFAAIPYGMVGGLIAVWLMGAPFGFMAFLGLVSLVGVIVSHIIVLFDFIEEAHERGDSFQESLLDAGILRLRPVMITVGATVIALFPLALHGGPLWQPMCYAQIGGLGVATFITLLLVPVIYAIAVLDLGIVKWETAQAPEGGE